MARDDANRSYGQYSGRDDDRGMMGRATDEVRSWFSDDDGGRRDEMRGDANRGYRSSGRRDDGYEDNQYNRSGGSYRDRGNDYGDQSYGGGGSSRMRSDRMSHDQSRSGSDQGYGGQDYGGRTYRDSGSGRMRSGDMEYRDRYGSNQGYGNQGYDSNRMGSRGMDYGSDRGGSNRGYGRSDGGSGQGSRGASQGGYNYVAYYAIYDGPHSGRGPEGYSRSSDRIVEDVNEALTDHGEVDASKIRVSAEGGEVTLEGTVKSRREKRMAEDAAESARGVRDVHNRLRVSEEDTDDEGEKRSGASSASTSNSGKQSQKAAASS